MALHSWIAIIYLNICSTHSTMKFPAELKQCGPGFPSFYIINLNIFIAKSDSRFFNIG